MHQKISFLYKEKPIEIAYTMRPGRDKAILFLHGLGASREDFQKAFEDERLNGYILRTYP
jgi:predicted esterase